MAPEVAVEFNRGRDKKTSVSIVKCHLKKRIYAAPSLSETVAAL